MRALVYDGKLHVTDVPMPRPGPTEALIKVLSAGICNTDLEIAKGYMGFEGVLGHEFVGIVEECALASLVGKRVVGEINCACGICTHCQFEMPHHCRDRMVLGIQKRNGAFAEYLTLPEENLHLVPNSIRDDVAACVEPTAAAFRIAEQVTITEEDSVVVLGDGKLGQLIAQVLHLRTQKLMCGGKHDWKLALLRDRGIVAVHAEALSPHVTDIVVDATGSADGLAIALRLVRPEGTVVLKTTMQGLADADLTQAVINEVTIVGSRCGPFKPALEALVNGKVEIRPMITEAFSLDDGVEAMQRAQASDVLKIMLHM